MERQDEQQQNNAKAQKGMEQMSIVHSLEAEGLVDTVDAWDMNEGLQDPKQSLPRPRSDLPKNKHHESIHTP